MEARKRDPIIIAGRYEVIDLIAAGGMAAVYRGWDYHIPRYVAIKALRLTPEQSTTSHGSGNLVPPEDPLASQRFRREAQAAAGIAHPNVVTIYDFIEEPHAQYLIMEFVDGTNLKHVIADHGTLSVVRTLAITEQICAALAAAHARGMVHRDIKPQNILLTPDGRARLTDFGIVRLTDVAGLTNSGIVLGTADYLSPEQAYGEQLGPASDLYSLGIVMYEMFTGVPPFTGANPVSVAMRHATEQVPSPRALNPNIPAAVEAAWRVAVAKEPRKRYRTAIAMARALRKCRLELRRPLQFPAIGEGSIPNSWSAASDASNYSGDVVSSFSAEPAPARFSFRRWLTRRLDE